MRARPPSSSLLSFLSVFSPLTALPVSYSSEKPRQEAALLDGRRANKALDIQRGMSSQNKEAGLGTQQTTTFKS